MSRHDKLQPKQTKDPQREPLQLTEALIIKLFFLISPITSYSNTHFLRSSLLMSIIAINVIFAAI